MNRLKQTLKIIVLAVVFLPSTLYSSNKGMNDYHNEAELGEFLTGDFFYPYDPLIHINKNTREVTYRHKEIERNAVNSFYPEHLNFLDFNFFPEFSNVSRCPNDILKNHITYIRYVFRLLTISYLFETLKELQVLSKHDGDQQTCSYDWKNLFGKCKPKSAEMKKFLKRIRPIYQEGFKNLQVTKLKSDIKKTVYKTWCDKNGQNCKVIGHYKQTCQDSRELIINMCSEKDDLYGISYVREAARILKTSNVMNIINREGHGSGCIDRYVSLFKSSEMKLPWLKDIIGNIFKRNIAMRSRYVEGQLFLPGALREFDEKGLTDFLFSVKIEEKKPPKRKVIKPIAEIIATPVPTVAPKKLVYRPKVIGKIKLKPKKKKKIKKVSEFEKKVKMREERSLQRLPIDMTKFSSDFTFDEETIASYDEKLKIYQTRKALMDMRAFDKLGSDMEPLRLRFIKYLIDTDKHQGLYNIQAVIGEKFYVMNDIENKKKPVYIQLENSERTKYKWQINILMDP